MLSFAPSPAAMPPATSGTSGPAPLTRTDGRSSSERAKLSRALARFHSRGPRALVRPRRDSPRAPPRPRCGSGGPFDRSRERSSRWPTRNRRFLVTPAVGDAGESRRLSLLPARKLAGARGRDSALRRGSCPAHCGRKCPGLEMLSPSRSPWPTVEIPLPLRLSRTDHHRTTPRRPSAARRTSTATRCRTSPRTSGGSPSSRRHRSSPARRPCRWPPAGRVPSRLHSGAGW